MSKWNNNSREAKLRNKLLKQFSDGDRMTKEDILQAEFNVHNIEQIFIAKKTIDSILGSIKNVLKQSGIPFGSLNTEDQWGIPFTDEEYKYGVKGRYKLVKGVVINTDNLWVKSGKRAGYLKEIKKENMLVSYTNGERKNEN